MIVEDWTPNDGRLGTGDRWWRVEMIKSFMMWYVMAEWSRIVLEQIEANIIQFGLIHAPGAEIQGRIEAKEGFWELFRIVI